MATTYVVSLVVEGHDKASGPLRNVSSALGNMGQIAGGILGAGVFSRVAQGIGDIFSQAFNAVGSVQQLQMGLRSLAAVELVNTGVAETFNEAIGQTGPLAQETFKWIRSLSLDSPFTFETVANAFQMNVAFGQTIGLAKKTTQGILNFSAATGGGIANMQGLAFALAQVGAAGQITMQDIRQLSNNRFGLSQLNAVFAEMSEKTGVLIENHTDFNEAMRAGKVTAEDFYTSFSEFVNTSYGDAAKLATRTLPGIASNLSDIMFGAMSGLFGSSGQILADFLLPHLDKVLNFIDSGGFEKIGEKLGNSFKGVLDNVSGFFDKIGAFFRVVQAFGLGVGLEKIFNVPPEVATFIQNLVNEFFKLGEAGRQALPVLGQIAGIIGNALLTGLQFVNLHWAEFRAALIAIGVILGGGALLTALSAIGAALLAINWPLVLIIGAVALLAAAWVGNWGNIQGITFAFFTWFQGAVQAVVAFVTPIWQGFLNVLTSITELFQLAQQGSWYEFGARLREIFDSIGAGLAMVVETGWTIITTKIQALVSKMIAIFKGTDWNGVGTSIIQGVISGIQNMAGELIDTMMGIAAAAYEAAMGFLEAGSPSKLFRDVGHFIMQGWALGISDLSRLPQKMLEKSMMNMFGSNLAYAYAGATTHYSSDDHSARYYAPITNVIQSVSTGNLQGLEVRV